MKSKGGELTSIGKIHEVSDSNLGPLVYWDFEANVW